MIILGIAFSLLAILATPIALIYLYPGKLELILAGWLVAVLAIIAALLHSLFRKKRHPGP